MFEPVPIADLWSIDQMREVSATELARVVADLVQEAKIKLLIQIEEGPLTVVDVDESRLVLELDPTSEGDPKDTYWFFHMDTA